MGDEPITEVIDVVEARVLARYLVELTFGDGRLGLEGSVQAAAIRGSGHTRTRVR
jgi:hypothetical protein